MKEIQRRLAMIEGTHDRITPEDIRQVALDREHAKPRAIVFADKMAAYAAQLRLATLGINPELSQKQQANI